MHCACQKVRLYSRKRQGELLPPPSSPFTQPPAGLNQWALTPGRAGARSVLRTLYQASSRATASLFSRFLRARWVSGLLAFNFPGKHRLFRAQWSSLASISLSAGAGGESRKTSGWRVGLSFSKEGESQARGRKKKTKSQLGDWRAASEWEAGLVAAVTTRQYMPTICRLAFPTWPPPSCSAGKEEMQCCCRPAGPYKMTGVVAWDVGMRRSGRQMAEMADGFILLIPAFSVPESLHLIYCS